MQILRKTISFLLLFLFIFSCQFPWAEAKTISRLHSVDLKQIEKTKKEIARDKAKTVLFVGDSVVYSSSARYDKDTIPSYFASILEKQGLSKTTHVYDLSLSGCSFTDTYEILKFVLPSRPDYIVSDLNVVWFAKGSSYATLANLHDSNAIREDNPTKLTFGEQYYIRWDRKNWDNLEGFPTKLGDYNYNKANEQWQGYLKIASLLKKYPNTKVILFLPPRNYALYSRYDLVDQSLYIKKTAMIKTFLPPNVSVPDYTWKVGSEWFTDIIHMLPQGNKRTAEFLFKDWTDCVTAVKDHSIKP